MQRRVFASPAFVLALVGSVLAAPGAQAPAPAAQTAAPAPAPNAATPENASTFIGDWTITAEGPNGPATFALSVKAVAERSRRRSARERSLCRPSPT